MWENILHDEIFYINSKFKDLFFSSLYTETHIYMLYATRRRQWIKYLQY